MRAARYEGLRPASTRASNAARGSSRKKNTKPEVALRRALRAERLLGYRVDAKELPGRPDVVFRKARVAVFCDGDFWHGRDLLARIAKLEQGHNAPYCVEKIRGNVARDRRNDAALSDAGWCVMRYWESMVHAQPEVVAAEVKTAVAARLALRAK
jgi:DNA mismatch endonuclease, patch repair protein